MQFITSVFHHQYEQTIRLLRVFDADTWWQLAQVGAQVVATKFKMGLQQPKVPRVAKNKGLMAAHYQIYNLYYSYSIFFRSKKSIYGKGGMKQSQGLITEPIPSTKHTNHYLMVQ